MREGNSLIFGGIFLNFNGALPGNEMVKCYFILYFSVTYNISFTEIICISMLHQLNVFFLTFFMKFNFLAF